MYYSLNRILYYLHYLRYRQMYCRYLWKLLLQVIRTKKHEITFHKVKGHADNPWNNRCDELATSAIREYRRLNGEKTEEEQPAKVGEEQKP